MSIFLAPYVLPLMAEKTIKNITELQYPRLTLSSLGFVWRNQVPCGTLMILVFPRLGHWPFQEPKLEVPTIYKAYFLGNIPRKYGLKNGTNVYTSILGSWNSQDQNPSFPGGRILHRYDVLGTIATSHILTNHFLVSQLGIWTSQYMGHKKCSKPPTSFGFFPHRQTTCNLWPYQF